MRTTWLAVLPLCAALAAPAGAQSPPAPLTYTQPLTPQAVQVVQQALQGQGAYTGRVDGVWGPDSEAALQRFQQAHGLQVTGQLNEATIATLSIAPDQILASPAAPPATAAAIPGARLSHLSVATVQSRLRDLNFYSGAIDGVWGGATQQAIEQFQQGRGLQVNGQLNPATITALGLSPGVLRPQP